MMLAHKDLQMKIEFRENIVNVLSVENKKYFTELVAEIFAQVKGEEGKFVLSERNKLLNIPKSVEIIADYFSLELNQKKLINGLYNKLSTAADDGENMVKLNNIAALVISYMEELASKADFEPVYKTQLLASDIMKMAELRFPEDYDSVLEKLTDYMLAAAEFLKIRCFVLVNFKLFFSDREIEEFYRFVFYNKLNVLLIEGKTYAFSCEKVCVIDEDLCEIY